MSFPELDEEDDDSSAESAFELDSKVFCSSVMDWSWKDLEVREEDSEEIWREASSELFSPNAGLMVYPDFSFLSFGFHAWICFWVRALAFLSDFLDTRSMYFFGAME